MFVSTVLMCGDVVSLGGKYVFATVRYNILYLITFIEKLDIVEIQVYYISHLYQLNCGLMYIQAHNI